MAEKAKKQVVCVVFDPSHFFGDHSTFFTFISAA